MAAVWTAAKAQGLDPTSYGATVFSFPSMLGSCWAGLAIIGCYGDYTCWTWVLYTDLLPWGQPLSSYLPSVAAVRC